jgi:hypothetical protein
MAMHQGFDLAKFKKISSDDRSTTMRHVNGHEVKIVHSALSSKMRDQIEALPMHDQAPVKMAKGGAVRKMYADSEEPVSADDSAPATVMDDDSPAGTDVESTPQSVSSDSAPSSADMPSINAANRPAGIPPPPQHDQDNQEEITTRPKSPNIEPPTIDVIGHKKPTMQSLTQQQAGWHQDLQDGHITPKTYQDLFAKQDTLSKVGTLFGLLISGAGSGLSHQPNMVMEMMNRTIQNDLDAQKTSKSNAVNYYNAYVNMLQGTANAENVASHTALNNMRISLYQNLLGNAQKIPPGQFQQNYMNGLQQLGSAIGIENNKDNARAVLAANQGHHDQTAFPGPVNSDVLSAWSALDPSAAAPFQREGLHIAQTRQLFNNYTKSWDRLNTITAGQTPQMLELASKAAAGFIPFEGLNPAAAELARNLMGERQSQIDSLPGIPQSFYPSGFDFMPGGGGEKARFGRKSAAADWFSLREGQNPNITALQKTYNVVTPQPYNDWASKKGINDPSGKMRINIDSSGLHVHQKKSGEK